MAEDSGRRKRRQPTSKLASMIAVENATVPIQFLEGQKKIYHLEWDELLTVEGEVPFELYEDLQVGTRVLAPWCDKDGDIDFSEAVVVEAQSSAGSAPTKKKCTEKGVTGSSSASKKKHGTIESKTRQKSGTPKKKLKEKAQACASKRVDSSLLLEVTKSGDDPNAVKANLGENEEVSTPTVLPPKEGSTKDTLILKDSSTKPTQLSQSNGDLLGSHSSSVATPEQACTSQIGGNHLQESTAANESTHKEAPALTSLSESISLLNQCAATEFSVEHSHFESSIVDNASISEGMMDSDPPHPTDYPRASEAFSPLSLPSSLSKGDPCSYSGFSSDCDRSRSMPPVNQRYQQEDAYFHTPIIRKPHPHVIQRRYTYPPAAGYSFCTPSTSDLDCTPYHSEDELSSFSGLSSISQRNRQPADFRYMSPVPSPDLQFVYTHWISPLKEQLADVQKELRSILTITASNSLNCPGPSKSGVVGCIASAQASVGGPGAQANSVQNAVDDDLGSDDVTKESNNGPGVYLGYPHREKYQCWVADLTQAELDAAERSSTDYIDLGKKLLQLLFSQELSEPDKYCCTKSDGKQLLDQLKLQGIRYHLHRKFCSKKGVKMYSSEEETSWDKCLKKMNARIRYERTLVKKGKK